MLELKLDIQLVRKDDILQLSIFDCTGEYDAVANPTGFGTPNLEIADITAVTLDITFPDGTVYNLDASSYLPNVDGTFIYLTYNDVTGNGGTFPDGKYEFTYTVTDNTTPTPVEYTQDLTEYFYNTVECCLQQKAAALKLEDCNCDGSKNEIEEVSMGWIALQALCSQVCLEQYENADESLEFIQKICNIDTVCSNC
jgi:hypothetical protein